MLDPNNPRSLIFQLERLQQHVRELPQAEVGIELEEEDRALLEAVASLKLLRMPQLLELGREPDIDSQAGSQTRDEMNNLLLQLDKLLKDFSRFVSSKHFDHRTDPQQLVTTFWGSR